MIRRLTLVAATAAILAGAPAAAASATVQIGAAQIVLRTPSGASAVVTRSPT